MESSFSRYCTASQKSSDGLDTPIDQDYLSRFDIGGDVQGASGKSDTGVVGLENDEYLNHDELIAFLTSAGIDDETEQEAIAAYLMQNKSRLGNGVSISITALLDVLDGRNNKRIVTSDDFSLETIMGADGENSTKYKIAMAMLKTILMTLSIKTI